MELRPKGRSFGGCRGAAPPAQIINNQPTTNQQPIGELINPGTRGRAAAASERRRASRRREAEPKKQDKKNKNEILAKSDRDLFLITDVPTDPHNLPNPNNTLIYYNTTTTTFINWEFPNWGIPQWPANGRPFLTNQPTNQWGIPLLLLLY